MPARANRIAVPAAAGPSLLLPDRFAPSKRRQLSAPGLRTFLTIAVMDEASTLYSDDDIMIV